MTHYYLDSSALVKRYVAESGSDWVQAVCDPTAGHALYTVRISGAEIVAALFQAAHTGALSLADAQTAAHQFKQDFERRYQIIEVTAQLVDAARALTPVYRLKGYAAVQLAAALAIHQARQAMSLPALVFVCADEVMNTAADAEGLPVINPDRPANG
jgi:uncharacterized protein